MGWTDGRLGVQPFETKNKQFFENEAGIWLLQRRVDVAAELKSAEGAHEVAKGRAAERAKELEKLRQMQDDAAPHRERHNPNFSRLMMLVFLAFGVLLLIADLPLTAQLATKSLGFPDRKCIGSNGVEVPVGSGEIVCEEGSRHLELNILSPASAWYFLDVLLLALALAACSLLIKAAIDSLYRGHLRRGSPYFGRSVAIGVAVCLYMVLLIFLGIVRNGVFEGETAAIEARKKLFESNLQAVRTVQDEGRRRLAEGELRRRIEEAEAQIKARRTFGVDFGFVLLTLLFPIACGILFHFFSHYWNQFDIARKLASDRDSAERAALACDEESVKLGEKVERLKELLSTLDSPGLITQLAGQWRSLYEQGWERGAQARQTFDSSASPFDRALYVVQRRGAS